MDKGTKLEYCIRIFLFYTNSRIKKDNFGTISEWCRYIDSTKHSKDKNIRSFVQDCITLGILEKKSEKNGNSTYKVSKEGAIECQYQIEKLIEEFGIEYIFDVIRNPKKGAFLLN